MKQFFSGAFRFLCRPRVASTCGFLLLLLALWFGGAIAGWSTERRMFWMMLAMLAWVLSLMVGKFVAERGGGLVERMLRKQADDAVLNATPEQRAEVTALRQRLLAAIDTLKSSKVGKARGKAALYELPWYMIIGHPAAGKSSAIQHSGLHFPFGDKAVVQGVGGTRNCDWFFSSEGVLLDTAGRYSTLREDRPEWLEFLKLLRKYRPKAPVNGVIVAVSFPELAAYRSEAFATYAKQVRQRINEVDDIFGCKVPVYLVFTKLDLLGGFAQFFEDCSEEQRQDVWGATLSHDQGSDFDALTAVGAQFDLLSRGLMQLGIDKLASHRGNQRRPALFTFPVEFGGLRDAVNRFVELLFHDDPFHSKPLLRGVYFTSALQDGEPRVATGQRIASAFDISRGDSARLVAPASHGYFLKKLFSDVFFADHGLITRQTRPSSIRLRMAGIVAGLLLVTAGVAALTWSFVANEKLVSSATEELSEARKLAASTDLADQLKGLQILQLRIEQLQKYRMQGTPFAMTWGLYRGHEVERALRDEYFTGVKSLMLGPVKASLERTLLALGTTRETAVAPKPVVPPRVVAPVRPSVPAPRSAPSRPAAPTGLPSIRIGSAALPSGFLSVAYIPGVQQGFVRVQASGNLPSIALPNIPLGREAVQEIQRVRRTEDGVPVRLPPTPTAPAVAPTVAAPTVAASASSVPTAATDSTTATAAAQAAVVPAATLEDGYNALKAYLMLAERERMDAALLSDQLPRHWRTWLAAAPTERPREEIHRLAERLVGFYVSQVRERDIPIISNRADIVAGSREVLRGAMQRMSTTERVFNEIKARANTQFAPLTVGRILDNRDLDLVSGSAMVGGAFTREAWEKYVSKAFTDASKGEIQGDDWVLATRMTEQLADGVGAARARSELEALYKTEFAREWKRFLQGIVIQPFANPQMAGMALQRLAEPQQSPLKVLFARAAAETAWDGSSVVAQAVESRKNALVERTERLILGQDSAPAATTNVPRFGPLGSVYAPLGAMTAASGQARPPIQAYFDVLIKLRARLGQIAAQAEPGAAARQLVQATLNESGSELSEGLSIVDTVLLAQASEETREIARPLLVRPLIQVYASLLPVVEQELDRAWQTEVLAQWKPLAARYPFSDSTSEASLADISKFLKPGEGTLAKFVDKQLGGLVVRNGNTLSPRSWANQGVRFQPGFLASVGRLGELAQKLPQDSEVAQFELQPIPTPGVSEILIEIDGQVLRYRNGPQPWTAFVWPNPAGTGVPGARVQVVSVTGVPVPVASFPGRLGLMRLLASARTDGSGGGAQLAWRFDAGKGDGSGATTPPVGESDHTVRFNMRTAGGINPLELSALRRVSLPERVAN